MMHLQGIYFLRAFASSQETPYPSSPLLSEYSSEQKEKELTEEEKKQQIENLFMRLSIMGGNFNRTHDKTAVTD